MTRHPLNGLLLLLPLALVACGPAPTEGDAAVVPPHDSGRADTSRPDNHQPDTAQGDVAMADGGSADTPAEDGPVVADSGAGDGGAGEDSSATDTGGPDSTRPDTAINDAEAPDSTPNYGPYSATDVPKLIQDADSNPVSTDSSINIAQDLAVHFVDVHFELSHADAHDLQVLLVPPFGSSTLLWNGDTCATGECPSSIVHDQRLDVYNSTVGNWILRVTDRYSSQTGTLLEYDISFVP